MKKIVGKLQPFMMWQVFSVVDDDGGVIAAEKFTLNELAEGVCAFAAQHDVEEVVLLGSMRYAKGIARMIGDISDIKVTIA